MLNEKQILPINSLVKVKNKVNNSIKKLNDKEIKKYKLIEMPMDMAKSTFYGQDAGSKTIKVRSDISKSLQSIKININNLQSLLSCQAINIDINNNSISDLARVGLEVHLNSMAGLSPDSNFNQDDYFIGPDYNKPIKNGYKLKVYGMVHRIPIYNNTIYSVINSPIEIYNIKGMVGFGKPKITKILRPVIDITQIFEDYGFKQKEPEEDFFIKSFYNNSNWNIFYNINNLKLGYTYSDLLSTLYVNNGEHIWLDGKKTWNGHKFVWETANR